MFLFDSPWKVSANVWFFDAFRRNQKGSLGRKWSWRAKSGHFENLNLQSITDNKTCRKPVKSYFSRKRLTSRKLAFVESKTILTGKKEIAKTMNDFCISVTVKLDLKTSKISNPIDIDVITSNFSSHVNIEKMRNFFSEN